jgi:hypothetical protein
LPFFAQKVDGVIYEVSLLGLNKIESYLKVIYYFVVILTILWGMIILALQNLQGLFWEKGRFLISLIINAFSVVVFVISLQPYASVLLFLFLVIKALSFARGKGH